jgi:hypothetical protein
MSPGAKFHGTQKSLNAMMSILMWIRRLGLVSLVISVAQAAPASPHGRVFSQPDGSETPELFLKGNQHYSWMSDERGYTVIREGKGGWWVYAKKVDGELVSSGIRVGYGNPMKLGLVPDLKTDMDKRPINHLLTHDGAAKDHRELAEQPTNSLCNAEATKDSPCRLQCLALLVRFSDHADRVLPDPEDYDILFNHNGPTTPSIAPSGSVAAVFMENSYDAFVMDTYVSPWILVDRTEIQTVGGNRGLNTYDTRYVRSTSSGEVFKLYTKLDLTVTLYFTDLRGTKQCGALNTPASTSLNLIRTEMECSIAWWYCIVEQRQRRMVMTVSDESVPFLRTHHAFPLTMPPIVCSL